MGDTYIRVWCTDVVDAQCLFQWIELNIWVVMQVKLLLVCHIEDLVLSKIGVNRSILKIFE